MKVLERDLETMPYDKKFHVGNGQYELCHATGKEVSFDSGNSWENEYEDSAGELYYGK